MIETDPTAGPHAGHTSPAAPDSGFPGLVLPAAGAVVFLSNIGCPFSHAALHRLLLVRADHGLDAHVAIDHQPLDVASIRLLDDTTDAWNVTVEAARSEEPGAGWATVPPSPGLTSRLAHEMVQSAKAQGSSVSVRLDRDLRAAYFRDGVDIDTLAGVMSVAAAIDELDPAELGNEFASGRAASEVAHHQELARAAGITTGPALATADGTVITDFDAETLEDLVLRAAASTPAE